MNIPEEDQIAIRELVQDPSLLDTLLSGIELAHVTLNARALASQIATNTELSEEKSKQYVVMMMNMCRTFRHIDESRTSFDAALAKSLNESELGSGSPVQVADLSKALDRILSNESIELWAKAHEIWIAHPRLFSKAQILSELRPIFANDSAEARAMIAVHQLRILSEEPGPSDMTREYFFALDIRDLRQLKGVVDRALEKHDSLKTIASSAKLSMLEWE
ncbi:MAG: hypothetical protein R3B89_35565 [Polyangiaceae bacterium]